MKSLNRYLVVFLLVAIPAAAQPNDSLPELPGLLSLDWCLQRARQANPALASMAASAAAASHRIAPAAALDDPRLAYEASNVPTGDFDFGSTPLSGHQLGLGFGPFAASSSSVCSCALESMATTIAA